jgi:hypothetical protein
VVEKSTVDDILEPLCRFLGASLVTFSGVASITVVERLIEKIEREPQRPTFAPTVIDTAPVLYASGRH